MRDLAQWLPFAAQGISISWRTPRDNSLVRTLATYAKVYKELLPRAALNFINPESLSIDDRATLLHLHATVSGYGDASKPFRLVLNPLYGAERGKCKWAVIDIDSFKECDDDLAKLFMLEAGLDSAKATLLCRERVYKSLEHVPHLLGSSRSSGGFHVWFFFQNEQTAANVRKFMQVIRSKLFGSLVKGNVSSSKFETFPRHTGDMSKCIQLPYAFDTPQSVFYSGPNFIDDARLELESVAPHIVPITDACLADVIEDSGKIGIGLVHMSLLNTEKLHKPERPKKKTALEETQELSANYRAKFHHTFLPKIQPTISVEQAREFINGIQQNQLASGMPFLEELPICIQSWLASPQMALRGGDRHEQVGMIALTVRAMLPSHFADNVEAAEDYAIRLINAASWGDRPAPQDHLKKVREIFRNTRFHARCKTFVEKTSSVCNVAACSNQRCGIKNLIGKQELPMVINVRPEDPMELDNRQGPAGREIEGFTNRIILPFLLKPEFRDSIFKSDGTIDDVAYKTMVILRTSKNYIRFLSNLRTGPNDPYDIALINEFVFQMHTNDKGEEKRLAPAQIDTIIGDYILTDFVNAEYTGAAQVEKFRLQVYNVLNNAATSCLLDGEIYRNRTPGLRYLIYYKWLNRNLGQTSIWITVGMFVDMLAQGYANGWSKEAALFYFMKVLAVDADEANRDIEALVELDRAKLSRLLPNLARKFVDHIVAEELLEHAKRYRKPPELSVVGRPNPHL
jgi:hypothetical protein